MEVYILIHMRREMKTAVHIVLITVYADLVRICQVLNSEDLNI